MYFSLFYGTNGRKITIYYEGSADMETRQSIPKRQPIHCGELTQDQIDLIELHVDNVDNSRFSKASQTKDAIVVSDDKTLKKAAAPAPVQAKYVGTQTACHWLQDNKSFVDSKLDLILSMLQSKARTCFDVTFSQDLIQIVMDQESTVLNLPVITRVDGSDKPMHTTIFSAQSINTVQKPVFQPLTTAPSSTSMSSQTTNT
jgi:hypothetical protein